MINPISLMVTLSILAVFLGISVRSPRTVGTLMAVLLSALIGWCGTNMLGFAGLGVFILAIFPLFILPALALKNRRMPWGVTLAGGTLIFVSVCGLCMKINFYPHWKRFEDNDAVLMAKLWNGVGSIAVATFVIALVVILLRLGINRWVHRHEGSK